MLAMSLAPEGGEEQNKNEDIKDRDYISATNIL